VTVAGRRGAIAIGAAFLALGVVPLVAPAGLSTQGSYALATMAFAGVLWVTGAIPLPVTAIFIPILLTVFGVFPTMGDALRGFADPIIFLLLAGFVMAQALQRHDLDRRIAYSLIIAIGTSPRRLILAVMAATAGLSMVVSNSATTAMMVPIALGIARQVEAHHESPSIQEDDASNLEVGLLLGTAYAASIGGIGTLIGTPGNAIVVARLEADLGYQIGFLDWLAFGLPMVVVTLPLAWYLLAYHLFPPRRTEIGAARSHAKAGLAAAGDLDAAAKRTVAITAATAGLWIVGGLDFLFEGVLPTAWYATLFGGAGSIVGGPHQGVLFYVLVGLAAVPAFILAGCIEWDDVEAIDWGTLILLGGGLALADGLAATDATQWLAESTVGTLTGSPVLLVTLAVVALTVLLSELASNTAVVAIFAPVLILMGPRYAAELGTTPDGASVFLALAGAIAASVGFALPVATPPNAIAFGTGSLDRDHMLQAGLRLDVVMIVVTTVALLVFAQLL
jgi:sodium-dependent dicarboxylate transporter 2/3/5